MELLYEPLRESQQFEEMERAVSRNEFPIHISGCIDTQKCHLIDSLAREAKYKIIVTYSEDRAKEIWEDYRFFDHSVFLYPAKDVLFYSADIHGNLIAQQRLDVLKHIIEDESATIVLTFQALMDQLIPLEELKKQVIEISVGQLVEMESMEKKLNLLGYERTDLVEMAGQFSVRGGILDIFPLTEECPYRIEFWGDEVDSIRSFDIESQRSIETIDRLCIYPAAEMILTKERIYEGIQRLEQEGKRVMQAFHDNFQTKEYARVRDYVEEIKEEVLELNKIEDDSLIHYFYEETMSFMDYFGNNAVFFLDEPSRIEEQSEVFETEVSESMKGRLEAGYILPSQAEVIFSTEDAMARLFRKRTVCLSMLIYDIKKANIRHEFCIETKEIMSYQNSFEQLKEDLDGFKKKKYKILLVSPSTTRAKRLAQDLQENEISAFFSSDRDHVLVDGEIMVINGVLKRGFEYPRLRLVVISERDIFSIKSAKPKKKKKSEHSGSRIHSFAELSVGDYVVHENHGLGIYRGIEQIEVDGVYKDYINIEYQGGSTLFILASQLDLIQKYASVNAKKPKLNKLGSNDWEKTKKEVRTRVKKTAQNLLELYAIRQQQKGFAFSKDSVWQKEFEELFPFDETEDQLTAIADTKRDMESHKIMDRLICGDVGYGKTEVAIRAAFKAVMDGKQVVYLVPTTILAQQHYSTFVERMKDYPIQIRMLSRFVTPANQRKIIEGLKKGQVDIVIGTHRVLSKTVDFKDLGLLIIDEEQRFGVNHKEKIKGMKKTVDVLSLSATPIPRTLHMSLVGIRDMSVLEEPPVDRRAIQTYVLEYNDEMVREAINRELSRGGQVYYVYNRVSSIDEITATVAKLVPNAKVAYAHGQMSERQLEKIMLDFINKEIDVLVSTTIIETGLDISNVNTMIIHDADKLGLSQLYQLRGRVGRSNRTAYAFLMYKRDKQLREVAEKRLKTIREFTDLGSGFRIAMRDLEIRGAGNLLGADQSGHMEAVGYDLYCKMLNSEVKRLKGEEKEEEEFATAIDIDVNAYIPSTYVKNEAQKLELYKRIASIENDEEREDMLDELIDRYGQVPDSVQNLLQIATIKTMAHDAYLLEIKEEGNKIRFEMNPKAPVKVELIQDMVGSYGREMTLQLAGNPCFLLDVSKVPKKKRVEKVKEVVKSIRGLLM